MKRENRAAIMEGIKESDLKGYKWTTTPDGLKWSYGEEFLFKAEAVSGGDVILTVWGKQSGVMMADLLVGNSNYCDASNIVDAYGIATKMTIRKANSIY